MGERGPELVRQLIFGIDPEFGLTGTYSYTEIPDLNPEGNLITCAHVPATKTLNINPMQETVFVGTLNAGMMFQSFRDDLARDGDEDVKAELISNRLDPSYIPDGRVKPVVGSKRLLQIFFPSFNSFEQGATMEYALDSKDATQDAVWQPFLGAPSTNRKSFKSGLCRWFNLRISASGLNPATIILSAFKVIFYDLKDRQKPE